MAHTSLHQEMLGRESFLLDPGLQVAAAGLALADKLTSWQGCALLHSPSSFPFVTSTQVFGYASV